MDEGCEESGTEESEEGVVVAAVAVAAAAERVPALTALSCVVCEYVTGMVSSCAWAEVGV